LEEQSIKTQTIHSRRRSLKYEQQIPRSKPATIKSNLNIRRQKKPMEKQRLQKLENQTRGR
jgi:hypothetical protein